MRVYIATTLENAEAHKALAQALAPYEVWVTYDWATHGSAKDGGPIRIREVALCETQGVLDADLVVVLLPGGLGTHTEMGMALAAGKPVVLVADPKHPDFMAPGKHFPCFYLHPLVRILPPSSAEEIAALVGGLESR